MGFLRFVRVSPRGIALFFALAAGCNACQSCFPCTFRASPSAPPDASLAPPPRPDAAPIDPMLADATLADATLADGSADAAATDAMPIDAAATSCDESACWASCASDGESLEGCRASCGTNTPCGLVWCYEQCGLGAGAFSSCVATCGYHDGDCDCVLSGSVRETCVSACMLRAEPFATCDALCASP